MAVGCVLPTTLNDTGLAQNTDTAVRPTWYDSIEFNVGFATATDGAAAAVCGTHADVLPIDVVTQSLTGCRLSSYADIFYNRIIITPNPLSVGNITADVSIPLLVFNAYFSAKSLDSVTPSNLDGIALTGASYPKSLSALEELELSVDVSIDTGPPTIDGSYLFDFESGVVDITVPVTGNRVLALPYLFQSGMQEILTFATQVMTSNDGYEQRTKLRGSPRQSFLNSIAIPSGEIASLDTLLYGWRINKYGLPITSECRELDIATSASSPNIDVNTEFGDFRVGGLAAIYVSPRDFELVVIDSFTTSQIVATTNITKVYAVGTLIMPVRVARLLTNPTRSTDGYRQRLDFSFLSIENTTLATSAAPDQYKSLDVYLEEPLTTDAYARDIYNSRVDVVDYGTGLEDTFAPWQKTKIARQFGLQFDTQEDVWNFRLWLHRREGKLRPFWMPTFENNLLLLSTTPLDLQLIVQNDNQDSLSTGRDDIAIKTTTGWLFRGVTAITPIGDDLEVAVDSTLGNIEPDTVEFISFMGRKRLSSDRIEIDWTGNNTAQVAVPITEINN